MDVFDQYFIIEITHPVIFSIFDSIPSDSTTPGMSVVITCYSIQTGYYVYWPIVRLDRVIRSIYSEYFAFLYEGQYWSVSLSHWLVISNK
jgi:hypothetical protein